MDIFFVFFVIERHKLYAKLMIKGLAVRCRA